MSLSAEATTSDIPFLDIVAPGFDSRSPEVAAAQARSWYAHSPLGLLVLRYPQAQELLRDRRLDHNGRRYMEMNGITGGPIYDWYVPMIVNHDGADHRRLRGLVNRAFTPRTVGALRPFIRARAQELAERLAATGRCEFVEDFANPLPLAVMCELLGVPAEDYDTFRVWTTDIGLVFSLAHGGDTADRVERAVVGLSGYVDSLISQKTAAPADDLISTLVTTPQTDGTVSREELRNLIVTLVFAAHDSTRHQFSNAMVAFAEHPDQWRLLGQRPDLASSAVEELIRWCPSAPTVFRFAAEDFDYQGVHVTRDAYVTVYVHAAQRDPDVFPGGDSFDITATWPTGPLQFGGGPHHCLGAALARTELTEALPVLAGRLGPPQIDGPVDWRPPIGIYGPNRLPLRFTG